MRFAFTLAAADVEADGPNIGTMFVRIATCALVVALSCAVASARRHAISTGLAPIAYGKSAPDFTFDVANGPAALSALRGKTIVLNFWATYCEPCTEELDAFARLRATYGDDVALVTVSDQSHDLTDALLRSRGIDAISLADPKRAIFKRYGVTPIPATLVIALDGTVRYVSIGEVSWLELQGAIDTARSLATPSGPKPLPT